LKRERERGREAERRRERERGQHYTRTYVTLRVSESIIVSLGGGREEEEVEAGPRIVKPLLSVFEGKYSPLLLLRRRNPPKSLKTSYVPGSQSPLLRYMCK
jgi:hypothetical protein